jgi:hypothetical protein
MPTWAICCRNWPPNPCLAAQVITTEPLGDELAASLLPQDYCVEDCNYLLDYYRLSEDKRLIFGGGVVYGARDPANIEAIIRPKMLKVFPQLANVKIDYAWTGNFLLTLSRLPQVGRIGDNIYYSQGCSGHGVTYTHLAGKMAESLRGQAERFDAFATCRTTPSRAATCCGCHLPPWVPGITRCATSWASECRSPAAGAPSVLQPHPSPMAQQAFSTTFAKANIF